MNYREESDVEGGVGNLVLLGIVVVCAAFVLAWVMAWMGDV